MPVSSRASDDPDLCDLISAAQAADFARWLGVFVAQPDLATLQALIGAFLGRVPFQNVTMLARPRRSPTLAEIAHDVLTGTGGPCGVLNPFFATWLCRLGYDARLLSGSMQQPDCHIAIMVRIGAQRLWLDVGNGHPYLTAIPVGDPSPRRAAGLTYRLRRLEAADERYAVEHLIDPPTTWRASYAFCPEPRPFRFFAPMIDRHYTQLGFGPFLGGLRLIRCPGGVLHAVRDRTLIIGGASEHRRELPDRQALYAALQQHFGDLRLPIEAALAALERVGSALYPAPARE